jgi:hypothetical protein
MRVERRRAKRERQRERDAPVLPRRHGALLRILPIVGRDRER